MSVKVFKILWRWLMAIINKDAIIMAAPAYPIDQIIGYFSGSVSIAVGGPSTSETFASDIKQTGFGDTCLIKGLYSVDGGTSWIDLGDSYLNGLDAVTGQLSLTSGTASNTDGTILVFWANTTTSAYTIQYNIVLIAKTDQGNVTPIPTVPKLSYTTKNNYMKIAFSDKQSIAASGTGTVQHNLNYAPNFLVWVTSDQAINGDNLALIPLNPASSTINNTTLTLVNNDPITARTFHYRIYLDA